MGVTSARTRRSALPAPARGYVEFVERELGVPVILVGTGAVTIMIWAVGLITW